MKSMTRYQNAKRLVCLAVLGCLFAMISGSSAMAVGMASGPVAGIWCSREEDRRLSSLHEEKLVRSLRRITGLEDLCFTDEGALSMGELPAAAKGSSIARQILWCALGSGNVFVIEDHSASPTVNFGQLDEGTNYEDLLSLRRLDIWRVRLDFQDFGEMVAPSEVRDSFDSGFTLLHELLHGFGYRDAAREDEVGECEKLVNQARAELGLPLRDRYFGESMRVVPHAFTVRLRFRSRIRLADQPGGGGGSNWRWQYLYFLVPAEQGAAQPQKGVILQPSRFLP